MGHRQAGKGKKRKRSWHRGKGEARQWAALIRQYPRIGTPANRISGPLPTPNRDRA